MTHSPQIKICGLTIPDQAAQCAALGADAIGLVFFPPSPRHLELPQARAVVEAIPQTTLTVGVFVNPEWDFLAATVEQCALGGVQLHGQEAPEMAAHVSDELGVRVIKCLFTEKQPGLDLADRYHVDGYLIECGKGRLPGGNAMAWNWAAAAAFARTYPTVLAGGLTPDNVQHAIAAALPDAVDASSGLEAAPGRKDLQKVERFIAAVRGTTGVYREKGVDSKPVFH